jgi:hypothetical protein
VVLKLLPLTGNYITTGSLFLLEGRRRRRRRRRRRSICYKEWTRLKSCHNILNSSEKNKIECFVFSLKLRIFSAAVKKQN